MDMRKKSGMTLVEILIVVALIALLAGVMVKSLGGSLEDGKKGTAKVFVTSTLPSAVQLYKVKHNRYPESLAVLADQGEISGVNDSWGHPYYYGDVRLDGVLRKLVVCNYGDRPNDAAGIVDGARTEVINAIRALNDNVEAVACAALCE
ncbi:MAG: type II secretion system GspH family protein [Puniceicoccales bacterium]|jgi:general secretion pathway protein G|nr:type II secretion system GspH family protein [Puniceicoccales bacterium]